MRAGLLLLCLLAVWPTSAQVLTNLMRLQNLVYELPAGDPDGSDLTAGPKSIAPADFDGDGAVDLAVSVTESTVTVFFGQGNGQGAGNGRFEPRLDLPAESGSLRGLVCVDFNADGRPDIAVAAPFTDRVVFFYYEGGRQFSAPVVLNAWHGVRNLAAGDFDGDGITDLVAGGPNNGLRQWRGRGREPWDSVQDLAPPSMKVMTEDPAQFPKPVYSLTPFRPPGATRDRLAVTHADTVKVWVLGAGEDGLLRVDTVLTNGAAAHAVEVAPLRQPVASGWPDLVTVLRDAGQIEIRSGTTNSPSGFGFEYGYSQRLDVPGGPRAVAAVDIDRNGWNDLVVVQRNFDSVLTYTNRLGQLALASERPVGRSPRELVAARFDADEYPDLAVLNRDSANISILLASPRQVGYRGVNHLYLVDGHVTGLVVKDFNGDGFADVMQLHRASGDFSVRLANPDGTGTLGEPTFYTVGNLPSTQVVVYINEDEIPDYVSASLGVLGVESGSISVRLGNGDGTFGTNRTFQLPDDIRGRLFAMVPADFNDDGNIDLAVGYLDSRLALFQGTGDGDFLPPKVYPFVNQARGLTTGDFDHDGDTDLAGAGLAGELWVVENTNSSSFFTAAGLLVHTHPAPLNTFGVRTVVAADVTKDGNLDLIVGGQGAWIYPGIEGSIGFGPPEQLAGRDQLVGDVLFDELDLNQDGNKDLLLACRNNDCLRISIADGMSVPVDAPSSRHIAVGDIDGDGLPDLVGTGRVLWTALSGHAPTETNSPLRQLGQRAGITNVVINELLAINTAVPLDGNLSDWIELYNGSSNLVNVYRWQLHLIAPADDGDPTALVTNRFTIEPPVGYMPPGQYEALICSTNKQTLRHTGWRLPAEGGTLRLLDASGRLVDEVKFPPQRANISYARYRDGQRAFVFNPFPTPRRPNPDNGLLEPEVKFLGVDPVLFQTGRIPRVLADARDDVGVSSLTLHYQRLDANSAGSVAMYDDGLHGDGDASDGCFGADLAALPRNGELQFYFEAVDLNDLTLVTPDEPVFSIPGSLTGNAYGLAALTRTPGLELSELVADNKSSLMDGTNPPPDWVEIRNTSTQALSLDGLALAQQIGDTARYLFPTGQVLDPGQHWVVYCDNRPALGTNHAPFALRRAGETLMLTGLTTNNSRTLVDWVSFGELASDEAFARLGAGGSWRRTVPTPYAGNLRTPFEDYQPWLTIIETNTTAGVFALAFPTLPWPGGTYTTEFTPSLSPPAWRPFSTNAGFGIEQAIWVQEPGFFRVRRD